MGCCDVPGLMPLALALENMLNELKNVCKPITLPLSDSLGYALSEDLLSPLNVPPFNNSAMDGYALSQFDLQNCSQDNPVSLTLVGTSMAGAPYLGDIAAGECIRIMTGAVLPSALDTVVMQEQVEVNGKQITFNHNPKCGDNVRFEGEDLKKGQSVLVKGHQLTVRDIPLLASLGFAKINVFSKLNVAIFSSGDELKTVGEELNNGDIYDSNRYGMVALLSRLNVEVIDLGIIKDDKDALRAAFIQADAQADVVISSGGMSVGEADFVKDILNELGSISFWKLAIKPGKPFAFGHLPNSVFLGLPGNPVASIATLYQLAVPAIEKLSGITSKPRVRFNAITENNLKKRPGRADFQRGYYRVNEQGSVVVQSAGKQGSGILSSMSQSNCFIVLAQESGNVSAGDTVTIEPYTHLLN
ncbi:molybdopterin molybdotransferase MoeA [Psychromonas sp. PT13]|uniref:molybdopterin molybdotransferase MoeA n=1 Tax=Psychromonas sp. PT13 TaxID=3439547 RepID=UPI003EB6A3B3